MATDAVVTQAATLLVTEVRKLTAVIERIDKSLAVTLDRIARALEVQAQRS